MLLMASLAAAGNVSQVRLGALFPMFKTQAASYSMDASGIDRFSAFKLAIDEINNKTDGVADDLLPNTQLVYAYRDSKRDDGSAFFGALELTQDTFGGQGVSAIVGAASSGPSMSAALVTGRMMVPQISYSSTSALLSDGQTYSYFLRTPPSDAFQGVGLADLIKNLFGFSKVATVSSTDGYGAAGIAAFHTAADELGLTILTAQTFAKDASDFTEQYRELKSSEARIIVIFCQANDAGPFMRGAFEEGIGGPGYLWIGSDATVKSDTWLNNDVLLDEELRLQVMKGFIGLAPSVGQGTAAYAGFEARTLAQPSTTGNGTSCNLATDDDGGAYIWAQDHDGDPATPLACGGNNNDYVGSYAPYAYDATYAIAHALHELIEVQGKSEVVGSELLDALVTNVSFVGVTGTIEFNDASTHPDRLYHGDRRVGISYDVYNYQSNAEPMVKIGKWTPCDDCEWAQRWEALAGIVYSTADNSIPPDVLPVPCGSADYNFTVCAECEEECDAGSLSRPVQYHWITGNDTCIGALPEDDSLPCTYVPLGSALGAVAQVVSALAAVICVGMLVVLVLRRNDKLVKMGQPLPTTVFCFGCVGLNLSISAYLVVPSDAACAARLWVFNLFCTMMLAALFQKMYRIWRLLDNPKMRSIRATRYSVLRQISGLVFVELVILTVWQAADPYKARVRVEYDRVLNGDVETLRCASDGKIGGYLALAQVLYKCGLTLYGCWLAMKTRKLNADFSDAKPTFMIIYQFAVVGLMMLVIVFLADVNLSIQVLLISVATATVTVASVLVLLLPKLAPGTVAVGAFDAGGTMGGTAATMNKTARGDSEGADELVEVKQELSDAREMIAELRAKLIEATSAHARVSP